MAWLNLIPSKAWWALAGAALLGLLAWWHQVHAKGAITSAIEADRITWQALAKQELADAKIKALQDGTKASMANMEVTYEISKQRDLARAVTDRTAGQLSGLRGDLAALRRGQSPSGSSTGPRSLADAAPAIAEGLEQCGERYSTLESTARGLSTKVTGLQAYLTTVIKPLGVIAQPEP
jgi:hypothetical protein